jgi:hypothetical protein
MVLMLSILLMATPLRTNPEGYEPPEPMMLPLLDLELKLRLPVELLPLIPKPAPEKGAGA